MEQQRQPHPPASPRKSPQRRSSPGGVKLPQVKGASPKGGASPQLGVKDVQFGPSAEKLLRLQMNGLRRVKRNVKHRRDAKADRRRLMDLEVSYAFQQEKMDRYKTSVLSQQRSLLADGVPMDSDTKHHLAHMPTEAMEAALEVSHKLEAVKRLGRAQIQASRGYDRARNRERLASTARDSTAGGGGWGKLEQFEPYSARMARQTGWDSRAIPPDVADNLKYTMGFVTSMERSHGRQHRAIELLRREVDRHGNAQAQPPSMVNTDASRDEVERAEREAGAGRQQAQLRTNLRAFHAAGEGDGTVADCIRVHDGYLQWKLDSCPVEPRPDLQQHAHKHLKPAVEAMQAAIALGGSGPRAKANHRNKDPGTPDKPAAKEVPPKVRLCRKIAAEAGVRPRVVQQHIASTLKEEPGWGMRTRKTMKSLGLTEGAALKDSLKQARLFREANVPGGPP